MAEIRRVQKIGNSPGIYLPRNMLDSLRISLKDYVYVDMTNDSIRIRKMDPKKGIIEE